MARTSRSLAKLTAKNQLTIPGAALEVLDWPTHFRVQVSQGALVLWPVALVAPGTAASALGLDAQALRDGRQATMRRQAQVRPAEPAGEEASED
ncbi:hypothetical protein [Roseomonas elaeocarpi]|uniref:AbrB/MazE/SpoVT family DNA-binding domain-containing protein n=1 Tax=Roseomonas elaeocarpi TaxID=907779 RepID=A0ABV6JXI8_9PROT